ncbi:MAG: arginine--tRNA ligase [Candidatus Nanopelagicales bacterium]
MTPEELGEKVSWAIKELAASGALPEAPELEIKIERPKNPDFGDYATNVALLLAARAEHQPRKVAELVISQLKSVTEIESMSVAGPGFINFKVAKGSQAELVREILQQKESYGINKDLAGLKINVEFISANPTGPLHLGHTRWAAVGDCLARVLKAAGAEVVKEFYINDRGIQMDKFGESIQAAALGKSIPEDGYHGAYIKELANKIVEQDPELVKLPEDEGLIAFREAGYKLQLAQQQEVLNLFRTVFDVWYSERKLHESGAVEKGIQVLKGHGHVFEEDGALWLRTTDFSDDKDRVLIKADGEYTYFASDTAYYVDKRRRGMDVNIYLLGADHHGYVNRLKAVAACAGDDSEKNIEVLIGQLVKMTKDGQEVKLSKRAGNIITLEDLVEEVGVDAARYTLSRYPADSPLTLDINLLTSHTNDNPVFYVQYAHARLSTLLRAAKERGIEFALTDFVPEILIDDKESDLVKTLAEYPKIVKISAALREPHRIARYAEELAGVYHRFYDSCRVLPREDEQVTGLTIARLLLCSATRQVLANALDLLGVLAPEKM